MAEAASLVGGARALAHRPVWLKLHKHLVGEERGPISDSIAPLRFCATMAVISEDDIIARSVRANVFKHERFESLLHVYYCSMNDWDMLVCHENVGLSLYR